MDRGTLAAMIDHTLLKPEATTADVIALCEEATDLGVAIRPMQTMAGHDSIAMNTVAPTVMMFIPSIDGVSHCERELTLDEDMLTGLDALTGVLQRMLDGALDGVEPAERY